MSPDQPKRSRFIAGAVCPSCSVEDRLVVEETDGERQRRCVSCGHVDASVPAGDITPPTRFARRGQNVTDALPIRLVDD